MLRIEEAQKIYDAQVPPDPDEQPGGEAHKFRRSCGCPKCEEHTLREAGEEKER